MRRAILERERRALGYVQAPPAAEQLWRDALAEIRERVEAQTLYSSDELDRLERAREKRFSDDARKQREGAQAERELVEIRQQRFDERARIEIDALKLRWPDVVAERNEALNRFHAYKARIHQIESAIAESRAVTDLTWGATRQLDDIERAGLRVRHLALPEAAWDDFGLGREIVRTIDVVHRAIAHRMRHLVSEVPRGVNGPTVNVPRYDL